MVKQGVADPDRLGIAGWSNGGFMTEYAITHTTRFKAAVAYSGLADFFSLYATGRSTAWFLGSFKTPPYLNRRLYDEHSPITNVKNCKTSTLIIQPENDEEVPLEQGKEFYQGLNLSEQRLSSSFTHAKVTSFRNHLISLIFREECFAGSMKILNSAKSLVSNPGCAHWHSLSSGAASQVVDPGRLGVLVRLELCPTRTVQIFIF